MKAQDFKTAISDYNILLLMTEAMSVALRTGKYISNVQTTNPDEAAKWKEITDLACKAISEASAGDVALATKDVERSKRMEQIIIVGRVVAMAQKKGDSAQEIKATKALNDAHEQLAVLEISDAPQSGDGANMDMEETEKTGGADIRDVLR